MMRHALGEGWLLLRNRGLISPVLALALAIPISLAGVTVTLRGWLEPVIDLGEREDVVLVLLHPSLDRDSRQTWVDGQTGRNTEWRLAVVESDELSQRLSTWFPYLEDLLAREGPEMVPPLVEITTRNPHEVAALTDDADVLAVGPTSSVNQVVGRVARKFSSVLLVIAAALAASAILLTAVWVHLEVHRNAEEIAIMRLMGATESTVKGPFLVAVAAPALIAAVVSVFFSVMSVGWIARLAEPLGLQVSGVPVMVLIVQVLGAVVLPLVTALVTLERYAKAGE